MSGVIPHDLQVQKVTITPVELEDIDKEAAHIAAL